MLEWKTGSICEDIVKGKKDLMKYGHQIKASMDDIRYADDDKTSEINDYSDYLEDILKDFKESKDLYELNLDEERNEEKGCKKFLI